MILAMRPSTLLVAFIHRVGLFIIGVIAMPVVIALNLLTKFLSAMADHDR